MPTEHMPFNPPSNPPPFHGKTPPPHVPPDKHALAAHWAMWLLNAKQGKLVYSETGTRSQLFHRAPGNVPDGTAADCSQMCATVLHWAGFAGLNDTDYTGTLLQKGKVIPLAQAIPGDVVIFGPGTGSHAALITERDGTDWWVVGFGHQGAPDRGPLSGTAAWFTQNGMPGVRILRFAP